MKLFVTLLVFCLSLSYAFSDYRIGKKEENQQTLWVETKYTPFYEDLQENIELSFIYYGENVISRITQAEYFVQTVSCTFCLSY